MSGRHRIEDQDLPIDRLWLGFFEDDFTQPLWPVVDLDDEGNECGNRLVRIFHALLHW
jgi:hypothetical protein